MSRATLAAACSHSVEVKKSRFTAQAFPCDSAETALSGIEAVSVPDATHNCWAYRIGTAYRSSDDGEPAGTAGRPILAAIDGSGLDEVAVVVTRWYGGIKLGAGGLVRAYGGTAAECLRSAPRREIPELSDAEVQAGYEHTGAIYALITQYAVGDPVTLSATQGLHMRLSIPQQSCQSFEIALRDATRGRATLHWIDSAP